MKSFRRGRIRELAIAITFALAAAACGSSTVFDSVPGAGEIAPDSGGAITGDTLPDPGANPATITYSLDETAAVTATIDSRGGEITTTRAGVVMSLVIPEGALPGPVDVTLTPVYEAQSELVDLTVGGAQFSPGGLLLAVPGYLKLKGAQLPDDLMAVSWDESGGEVTRSMTLPTIGGGVRIPVVHFSGAGAGTPGPGESGSSPSSKNQRALDLIQDEWNANGHECVDAKSAAGVTALNFYIRDTKEDLIPALIGAQSDDNSLVEAGRLTINWWALPDQLEMGVGYLVCEDLIDGYSEIRDTFTAEVVARLKAGLTHAMFEASRQCKARSDLGEIAHMSQWTGMAMLLEALPGMGEGQQWSDLLVDLVEACALYRVELRTQLTLEADEAGRIRGTIAAVAANVPDTAQAEYYGYQGEDRQFPFGDPSYRLELPHDSDGCVYEDQSKLDPITGLWLSIDIPEPERKIAGLDGATAAPGDSPKTGATGGLLVVEKLNATGTVIVHCDDTSIPLPIMATFVPGWFDKLHGENTESGELEFNLHRENSSTLVASFTTDEPLIDPTDASAKVDQHTEIKVYLTPKSSGRTEPKPPPVPFRSGDSGS